MHGRILHRAYLRKVTLQRSALQGAVEAVLRGGGCTLPQEQARRAQRRSEAQAQTSDWWLCPVASADCLFDSRLHTYSLHETVSMLFIADKFASSGRKF